MSTANANGHQNAFPQALPREQLFELTNGYGIDVGLTKREYFAAMAMQGLSPHYAQGGDSMAKHVAKLAVETADALLEELAK